MKKREFFNCYNCQRELTLENLPKNVAFKCKGCYTTLFLSDQFSAFGKRMTRNRDLWIILGITIGLLPMLFLIAMATSKPIILTIFYLILNLLFIGSFFYFRKRAIDLILGIIFAEIGVYLNITRIVFLYYGNSFLLKNPPNFYFQIYFFLLSGIIFIFWGLRRRKSFQII